MTYEFFAPPRIVFGWGRRLQVGELARSLGRRAFVVSGSRSLAANGVLVELFAAVTAVGVEWVELAAISREPEVEDVDAAAARLVDAGAGAGDLLLAVGGGSAIDLAKAAAAMATNRDGGTVVDYLEGVGRGLQITRPSLPVLAMPTTAGTGSEATKNAVISSSARGFKKSLRSDSMVPRAVLIDPELTVSVPPAITAQTGMDAVTQLIESYISRRKQPIPRALATQGLAMAMPALAEAYHWPASRSARENMAHAALLSGIALASSGLGMAHGVAAALGVHCGVAHGLACAVMLPVALRTNRQVAQRDLAELHRATAGGASSSDAEAADEFVERIDALGSALSIPRRLSEIGVSSEDIPRLVTASRGNSMSGNPRELSDAELTAILEGML